MTRMKDSGIEWIGEVPEDWGITKIKFTTQLNGRIGWQGLTSAEYKEEGPYLITGTDFLDGKINFETAVHIDEKRWFEAKQIQVENGDLLITKDGTVGKVAIIEGLMEKASLNSGVLRIQTTEVISRRFLFYVLKSDVFWLWFNYTNSGASTILHLYQNVFDEFSYAFPKSLFVQTQIANFLDKKVAQLDSVKSLLEEQVKTLEDYRQSLIYETVTKGLDKTVPLKDSGVDWIGQIPEGWGVKPIKYCSRFQRGFGFPVELQGNDDGEIPFYKVSDLRGNSDEISISKNYVDLQTAKQNAWVIVPSGAIIAPVIGAALLNNNRKISTVPFISDNNTLAIIPNNKNKYFYYLFKVIDMNWFNNSSTIPAVNISKLANQIVPTPKEEEQKQIADFLEVQIIKIDKLIEIKQKQINNINQQRQTLIYDVVTGKRRV